MSASITSVKPNVGHIPTNADSGAEVQKAPPTKSAVGSGNIEATGKAPPVPTAAKSMNAAMASLLAMVPQMAGDLLDVMLLQITTKMKDSVDQSEKGKIETDSQKRKLQIADKTAKLEESQKKIDEAQAKQKETSKISSIFGAIFNFLSAIVQIVVGIALIATGAGAVNGAAMIAAGALTALSAVDSIVAATNKDGLGIVGLIAKEVAMKNGASEEDAVKTAKTADMIAQAVVTTASLVLSVASGLGAAAGAASGAASAATSAASATMKAVDTGAKSASVGINVASAATKGIVAGVNYGQQKDYLNAVKSGADAKSMEAVTKSLDEAIDQAMTRLKGASDRFDAMLDGLLDAIKDRAESVSRVGVRA
ncbi:MAG: type III secretion system translocon subunit SctE [Parafilimonas terrae]|nr:type III secretion system translocon subunit SctE [Parafilimonas terrae]